MTYEKDPFELEDIPDYALQPARDADEYNFHYIPRGTAGRFDAAAYEKVLRGSVQEGPLEPIEPSDESMQAAEPAFDAFSELEGVVEEGNRPEQPAEAESNLPSEEQATVDPAVFLAEDEAASPVLSEQTEPAAETITADAEADEVAEPEEEDSTAETASPEEEVPMTEPVSSMPDSKPAGSNPVNFKPTPVFKPVQKVAPVKIRPAGGSLVSSKLKLVDIKQKEPVRIFIEEDLLVPDVKPDLARIIAIDGKIKLSEKEIHTSQDTDETVRIAGELILQTLYVPENPTSEEPMVSIESRLPFRSEAAFKTGPYSDLALVPVIESIDYTIVNERKIRVKAAAYVNVREYSNVNIEVFEGIYNEELQMLKEKIHLTDVALRKSENTDLKEDLTLKENLPEIQKILKYDVNVVENHKQITKEKAVVNASVYCNVMYLGSQPATETEPSADVNAAREESGDGPVLYQGKTEFTQFIRFDGDQSPAGQNPAGSKVNFNLNSLNLKAKEDGNGKRNLFELEMNVDTGLELYKNIEKEVVTDVYHHRKDLHYDTEDIAVMSLSGSGVAELSVREIVNVPEKYGGVEKVAYISGNIAEKKSYIEQGKSIVEGTITIGLICTAADEKKTAFSISQEVPFRSAMEIPEITADMVAGNDILLKELWFEKINNRQIEVNAGIQINTAVSSQKTHTLVKNVSFLEGELNAGQIPGIIVYISKAGDTIWKVAKKYKTTIDELRKMNDLDLANEIKPGTKLLIVAKKH